MQSRGGEGTRERQKHFLRKPLAIYALAEAVETTTRYNHTLRREDIEISQHVHFDHRGQLMELFQTLSF